MSSEPGKRGRPTLYTEELAAEIIAWIGSGKTLRTFCQQEGKPDRSTIYDWRNSNDEFSRQFQHARDVGYDEMAEETLEIADDATNDTTTRTLRGGAEVEAMDSEWVARSKLRVDTRIRLLGCWDPRRYGQKQQLEHSGKLSLESLVLNSLPKPDASSADDAT